MAIVAQHEAKQILSSESLIQQFCLDYFTALNASCHWEGHVLVVELDETQASFLVGATSKPLRLRLVFSQSHFEQTADAELVVPGSFRLDQMINSVIKRGSLTCQFGYTAQERENRIPVHFVPYLFLICQLSYLSPANHLERWVEIACDLVDGTIIPNPYQYLVPLYRSPEPPAGARLEKRRISYKQGFFTHIGNYLLQELAKESHDWAINSHKYLAAETEQLEEYFSHLSQADETPNPRGERVALADDLSDMTSSITKERELRIKEAALRCTPQVIIRPLTAAIIYLSDQARLQFRDMVRERRH